MSFSMPTRPIIDELFKIFDRLSCTYLVCVCVFSLVKDKDVDSFSRIVEHRKN